MSTSVYLCLVQNMILGSSSGSSRCRSRTIHSIGDCGVLAVAIRRCKQERIDVEPCCVTECFIHVEATTEATTDKKLMWETPLSQTCRIRIFLGGRCYRSAGTGDKYVCPTPRWFFPSVFGRQSRSSKISQIPWFCSSSLVGIRR